MRHFNLAPDSNTAPQDASHSDESRGGDARLRQDTPSCECSEDSHFSLTGLMGLVTLAAVIMAVGIRLPRPVFAGAMGFLTLLTAIVISLADIKSLLLHFAWWLLLAIYLAAIGLAIID